MQGTDGELTCKYVEHTVDNTIPNIVLAGTGAALIVLLCLALMLWIYMYHRHGDPSRR